MTIHRAYAPSPILLLLICLCEMLTEKFRMGTLLKGVIKCFTFYVRFGIIQSKNEPNNVRNEFTAYMSFFYYTKCELAPGGIIRVDSVGSQLAERPFEETHRLSRTDGEILLKLCFIEHYSNSITLMKILFMKPAVNQWIKQSERDMFCCVSMRK